MTTAHPGTVALALVSALLLTRPAVAMAQEDMLDLVNELRLGLCPRPAAGALEPDPALDAVAAAHAGGRSLQQALEWRGYRAAQAAAIRLDAVRLDARQIRMLLRERFCGRLTEPGMNVAASVRRGETLWLVIAERRAQGAAAPPKADTDAGTRPADRRRPSVVPGSARATVMLALVNAARAQARRCGATAYAAAPPLQYSRALEAVAMEHARDMARRNYFDHDTPEGVTPSERLARIGYASSLTGENIAKGEMTAEEALRGWLASPGHCANIMDRRFTEMGFGLADGGGEGDLYWVQTFATPRGASSSR